MKFTVLAVESTPNQNACKFVLSAAVFETTLSFFSADAAASHPLGTELFAIAGVRSILLLGDFVTINKSSDASWTDISKAARAVLTAAEF